MAEFDDLGVNSSFIDARVPPHLFSALGTYGIGSFARKNHSKKNANFSLNSA